METYKTIFASAFGTFVAEIATIPICTLKTVYQNNSTHTISQSYKSIYNILYK